MKSFYPFRRRSHCA